MRDGPREKLLYVICVQPGGRDKPDYLATVDADPESPDYCKVMIFDRDYTLYLGEIRKELTRWQYFIIVQYSNGIKYCM